MDGQATFALLIEGNGPDLARLHAQCFPLPWSPESFEELLRNDAVHASGAWAGRTLVAALLVQCAGDTADIVTLMTAPSMRQQGLSKELMRLFLRDFLQHPQKTCFLEVAQDNIPALELYKSLNFKICGARKDYYDRPHGSRDAWVLRLP